MSVLCGSRGFCSSLIASNHEIDKLSRTRSLSQISLARKWKVREGNLRLRRQRTILRARPSVTEDAENGNPGKPESAGDSVDIPEASSRRNAAEFDGCIADFLPPSEQQVLVSLMFLLIDRGLEHCKQSANRHMNL